MNVNITKYLSSIDYIYNNREDVLMIDVNILFGTNAGKIWGALDSNKTLTKNQIIEKTNMTENEFFQAIGWLAKENKVKKEGEFYQLDETKQQGLNR